MGKLKGNKEIHYFKNGVVVHRDNDLKRYYIVYDGVCIGEPSSTEELTDADWNEILQGAEKL